MGKVVLECKNLKKSLNKKQIIKDVSFTLEEGDILGFIGSNGAGKTTTIKLILGLQLKDSGSIKINGYDLEKNFEKAIERVGSIVETPDFYTYLSGYKNLEISANYYKNITKERIDEVSEFVGLKNRIHDKVSTYSLGMKQRLDIADAILHKPNILILDEPTNGLDPEGIKDLRELLVKLSREENMSIFISSHNLSELENICTKICIIKDGQVIDRLDMREIESKDSCKYYFEIDDASKAKELFEKIKINFEIIYDKKISIQTEKERIPEIIEKMCEYKIKIYEVKKEEINLEDIFIEKVGGNEIV